jgi:hypothetical protein
MPTASAFWHLVSQSGTGAFRYQIRIPNTSTWLLPALVFYSFQYRIDRMQHSLAFRQKHCRKVEKDTPYTSILLAVERDTPCLCADVGQRCTLHIHTTDAVDGYSLQVHITDDGKEYPLHIYSAADGKGCTLHIQTASNRKERDTLSCPPLLVIGRDMPSCTH